MNTFFRLNFVFLLIVFVYFQNLSFCQVWFDFGLNGGVGTGFFTNSKLYSDNRFNVIPKIHNNVSFKMGINPTELDAIVLEIGSYNRVYEIDQFMIPGFDDNSVFNQNIAFNGFQTAILYRRTNESSFIEIGPMLHRITSQNVIDEANLSNSQEVFFEKSCYRLVAGLGGFVFGTERVTLVTGIRLIYDLSDLRASSFQGQAFPFQNYNDSSLHHTLRALDFQINLELNVSLGFLYRSQCGKRQLIFQL